MITAVWCTFWLGACVSSNNYMGEVDEDKLYLSRVVSMDWVGGFVVMQDYVNRLWVVGGFEGD